MKKPLLYIIIGIILAIISVFFSFYGDILLAAISGAIIGTNLGRLIMNKYN